MNAPFRLPLFLGGPVPVQEGPIIKADDKPPRKRLPGARPITDQLPRMSSRAAHEVGEGEEYPQEVERPKTRAECRDGARPCPFVSCKHHLALEVNPERGSLKVVFPTIDTAMFMSQRLHDVDWDAMKETCALDVAERRGETLEVVGRIMNVTRERTRQIEEKALRYIAHLAHPSYLPKSPRERELQTAARALFEFVTHTFKHPQSLLAQIIVDDEVDT